ncbi:DNA cytosine methyltransferase [bacterium]|nr:DNA cytosine methyltransferase [bacterium]
MTTYGSVCSGIESASVAWEPLGMRALWLSEVEPFPCSVLAHHWPTVANVGDMNTVAELLRCGLLPAPDVLVGGTPCQAFSVAGLRKGLGDARGQLTLTYVDILNAIDEQRPGDEAACVWENVPGVLSSRDNAFGCFLAALCGEDEELKPPGKRWANAGCVFGPQRAVAWRVLDAQYFGVAQRRRRVFVVASAREGFDPRAVLFESEGLRRDTPPSREAQTVAAALTARGVGTCGADGNQAQGRHLVAARLVAFGEYAVDGVASTCQARGYKGATDLVVHGTQDPCVLVDLAHPVGRNGGGENVLNGVRRLTPTECERLQGFPDGHTDVPGASDAARYRAIGNSKAVPVVRWVGERLKRQLQ